MPKPTPETIERLLQQRERVARAAAAAIAHRHDDADLLENAQMDLEEALEDVLPRHLWRLLMPTWRELDLLLVHDPTDGQRDSDCVLCAKANTAQPARSANVRRLAHTA